MNKEILEDLSKEIIIVLSEEIDRESYSGWYNAHNAAQLVEDCIEQFLKRKGLYE